jgi:uncharacterized membrane protein YfcA
MENLVGYLASALIGVSLGLIGGGGSIITIPVLVYLFHIEPTLATAYSLFIVGTTSLVGGIRNTVLKTVDFKSALLFSIPSTLAVYFTRHFLLPHIPEHIASIGSFTLTKDIALMLFFSLIMVLAALRMIRDKQGEEKEVTMDRKQLLIVILQGFIVGIVTGIIGAGGGFLIIPALVLLVGLPMKKAIGTSLIVIAINSLIGFMGDMHLVQEIDFPFMMILSGLAVMGVFFGMYLSRFIDGKNLKSGFGWFALAMAIFIIMKELAI